MTSHSVLTPRFRRVALLPPSHHHPRNPNADKIQQHHHAHHQQHGHRVGRWSHHRRDHRDGQESVLGILNQEFRGHNAKKRQKENQHRQFKHQSQRDDHQQHQVKIIVDLEQWNDRSLKSNQKIQDMWQGDKIRERDTRQKQKNRRKQESSYRRFFIAVQRGRYE